MADKKINCKDCGNEFIFTEGEQQFYAEKGFENEPVRCKDCRAQRKARSVKKTSFDRNVSSFNSVRVSRF